MISWLSLLFIANTFSWVFSGIIVMTFCSKLNRKDK